MPDAFGVTRHPRDAEGLDTLRDPDVTLRCYVGAVDDTPYEPGTVPPLAQAAHAPVVDASLLQAFKDAGTYLAPACLLFAAVDPHTRYDALTLRLVIDYRDAGADEPDTVTYDRPLADATLLDGQFPCLTYLFAHGPAPDEPEAVASFFQDGGIHIIDVSEDSESGFPAAAQLQLRDADDALQLEIPLLFVNVMPNIDPVDSFSSTDAS